MDLLPLVSQLPPIFFLYSARTSLEGIQEPVYCFENGAGYTLVDVSKAPGRRSNAALVLLSISAENLASAAPTNISEELLVMLVGS